MAVQTITINTTDITDYLEQSVGVGFEYRSGDEGYTANGTHYQNIIAKKEILTLNFRPLKPNEYSFIRNIFQSTDEYTIVFNGTTKNYFRSKEFKGTNVGDQAVKDITIELKEI